MKEYFRYAFDRGRIEAKNSIEFYSFDPCLVNAFEKLPINSEFSNLIKKT